MAMEANDATLDAVAARLRRGAAEVEGVTAPPSAPNVGACTPAVAATLSYLMESMAGISAGLSAAADTVTSNNQAYQETEGRAEIDLKRYGPR